MRFVQHGSFVVFLSIVAGPAAAQGAPGTRLEVDVSAAAISLRADTISVAYRAYNHVDSDEDLFILTVDAPAGVLRILTPEPSSEWNASRTYRGRSVARWARLGVHVAPGDTTPPLVYEALGLPGIVAAWYRGYYPPPPVPADDSADPETDSDPLISNSVRIHVVGVDAIPPTATVASLMQRLQGLTQEACGLQWVTDPLTCGQLQQHLAAGTPQLSLYVQLLEARRGSGPGKGVTENAYWLLKVNAEYIVGRM